MSTSLYRDSQMEQELRGKIDAAANERHGGAVPADVQERIAAEKQHIFGSGHGTLLAVAAKLAEFSESRGCPVGFRGLTGNLYLSHILGLAAVDPMELGLRWAGCWRTWRRTWASFSQGTTPATSPPPSGCARTP